MSIDLRLISVIAVLVMRYMSILWCFFIFAHRLFTFWQWNLTWFIWFQQLYVRFRETPRTDENEGFERFVDGLVSRHCQRSAKIVTHTPGVEVSVVNWITFVTKELRRQVTTAPTSMQLERQHHATRKCSEKSSPRHTNQHWRPSTWSNSRQRIIHILSSVRYKIMWQKAASPPLAQSPQQTSPITHPQVRYIYTAYILTFNIPWKTPLPVGYLAPM